LSGAIGPVGPLAPETVGRQQRDRDGRQGGRAHRLVISGQAAHARPVVGGIEAEVLGAGARVVLDVVVVGALVAAALGVAVIDGTCRVGC
jgi:hypothetical protein